MPRQHKATFTKDWRPSWGPGTAAWRMRPAPPNPREPSLRAACRPRPLRTPRRVGAELTTAPPTPIRPAPRSSCWLSGLKRPLSRFSVPGDARRVTGAGGPGGGGDSRRVQERRGLVPGRGVSLRTLWRRAAEQLARPHRFVRARRAEPRGPSARGVPLGPVTSRTERSRRDGERRRPPRDRAGSRRRRPPRAPPPPLSPGRPERRPPGEQPARRRAPRPAPLPPRPPPVRASARGTFRGASPAGPERGGARAGAPAGRGAVIAARPAAAPRQPLPRRRGAGGAGPEDERPGGAQDQTGAAEKARRADSGGKAAPAPSQRLLLFTFSLFLCVNPCSDSAGSAVRARTGLAHKLLFGARLFIYFSPKLALSGPAEV